MKTKAKLRAGPRRTGSRPPDHFVLRLFVAGATALSQQAILKVRELSATRLPEHCRLEVIDIYQQPGLARRHQIVATPTLVVALPVPMRRFIGSLTSLSDVFLELDLGLGAKATP